jgi:ABC-type dipeptide/oligopeptide/nickel transport system permease subunit
VPDARWRAQLRKSRSALVGASVVGVLVVFSVLGPWLSKHGPYESDFVNGVSPGTGLPVGPCAAFPLGTDPVFRDVLARLAAGGRISLTIAVAATALATCIGAVVGIVAGFQEGRRMQVPWPALAGAVVGLGAGLAGWPRAGVATFAATVAITLVARFAGPRLDMDGLLMRLVDVLLAFPFLILVMALGAALEQTSAVTIFVTLGVTGWLGTARLLRAKTMQMRSLAYVDAARALGQSTPAILWKHVLPNVAGPLVVMATMLVAQMIVADSVLSYLGVGIAPPTPTWGRMLSDGQDYYASAPWLVIAPGAAIVLAVWGFNLLGEGLRDAFDPHEV